MIVLWVALGLAALAVLLVGPVPPWLARAAWPQRAPRAALVLWQVISVTATFSAVGAGLGGAAAPLATTVTHGIHRLLLELLSGRLPPGFTWPHYLALCWAAGVSGFLAWRCGRAVGATWRKRRAHRHLIDVVSRPARELGPDVGVLPHAEPAAYCVPGHRSRIMITTGALKLLDERELRAVLAHERAHASARHDLAVLPFTALAQAIPRLAAARHARDATHLLVEMLADDRARRVHGGRVLARALVRFATRRNPVPPDAFAAADDSVLIRVQRLVAATPPIPLWQQGLVYAAAAGLLLLPIVVTSSPLLPALV